jgi:hypothetical protein
MSSVQVPTVGSRIKIELIDRFSPNMIPPGPRHREFEGEVLPSYRWLTDREFCITGDDAWPVRVINMANVQNIVIQSGSTTTVQTSTQTYHIAGSKGAAYTVTRSAAGWHCQCKGFEFRGRCRHIEEAQKQP